LVGLLPFKRLAAATKQRRQEDWKPGVLETKGTAAAGVRSGRRTGIGRWTE